ncbi:MAG: DUF1365 domain-containing protein [Proteobacteria bacterium]|nr:DUF1365 domain-containing protein [Pseudomonadota bacterium]
MPQSCLYFGKVMHARLRPFRHRFVYGVFSMLVDLERLPELDRESRLFGHNRARLFSFHDADHGARDGTPALDWVRARLVEAGLAAAGAQVFALCFPRILGYVFNPLTVYFAYDRSGRLGAILYEVKNTFGEQHGYLIPVDAGRAAGSPIIQRAAKRFHVSPFIDMRASYRFRIDEPEERLALLIREDTPAGELLTASQTAGRVAWSDAALLRAFFRYPLMTAKVMGAIHWEAFRLWIKGAKYHRHPAPPAEAVETIGTGGLDGTRATGDRLHARV